MELNVWINSWFSGNDNENLDLKLSNMKQDRTDFMQLLMNAHKDPSDEKQEDKEHDKEFKEMHKGVTKRGQFYLTYEHWNFLGIHRQFTTN